MLHLLWCHRSSDRYCTTVNGGIANPTEVLTAFAAIIDWLRKYRLKESSCKRIQPVTNKRMTNGLFNTKIKRQRSVRMPASHGSASR